jgi:ubiquinone/menaquinone biosynthesis C-methylase UbiE
MLDNNHLPDVETDQQSSPTHEPIEYVKKWLVHLWISLVQLGFSLLYHQFAWSYDTVSWLVSFGAWRDWQRSALPFVKGPRVLEIAHGPGHMLIALNQQGFQVTGIDLSSQMGRLAQKRVSKTGSQISILQSSAQNIPLANKSFDSVLATFPTEFIIDELTLIAVNRILKKDGLFVIVPEAKLTSRGLVVRAIEWLYGVTGQRNVSIDSSLTPQSLQEPRWQQIDRTFKEFGFLLEFKVITLKKSEVIVIVSRKFK